MRPVEQVRIPQLMNKNMIENPQDTVVRKLDKMLLFLLVGISTDVYFLTRVWTWLSP